MIGTGWDRIEAEWLAEILEALPRPWPEAAALAWLRHAHRLAARGRPYWLPQGVAPQIAAAARRGEAPGRRALAEVSGLPERSCRRIMESDGWLDPLDTADTPAEGRPGSVPPASRVPSRVRPGYEEQNQPLTDIDRPESVPPASRVPSRVRPDRARDLRARTIHQDPTPDLDPLRSVEIARAPESPPAEPDRPTTPEVAEAGPRPAPEASCCATPSSSPCSPASPSSDSRSSPTPNGVSASPSPRPSPTSEAPPRRPESHAPTAAPPGATGGASPEPTSRAAGGRGTPAESASRGADSPERPEPGPPPAEAWPHPAAPLLAERCPELALELRQSHTWAHLGNRHPDEVALIAAWALDAPHPQAERLRLEQRVHRRGGLGLVQRPRFLPRWLCDPVAWPERLSWARRWRDEGGFVAVDALGPEVEEGDRAEVSRQDQLRRASDLWDNARSDETRERARTWVRLLDALDPDRATLRPAAAPPVPRPAGRGSTWGAAAAAISLDTLPERRSP